MKKLTAIITALLILCSVIVPVITTVADSGTPLTNLYNADYYDWGCKASGKEVTFDADGKVITMTGGEAKALVNYSEDMTTFDASVVIQGNTSVSSADKNYGLIYGGIIFHVDKDDFNAKKTSSAWSFNSTGYAVIVKREKNATKATIIVRYISNNTNKKELSFAASNIPFAYDGKVKLNVSVTTEKFIITVTDVAGTTTYGTNEYPLDNTTTYPATAYYPSGAIGLVSNGYHKYYDFNVTATSPMANIPQEVAPPVNPLEEKYDLYGVGFTTETDNYTTTAAVSRGTLKTGSKNDFSTSIDVKMNAQGEGKAGIIFRASNFGTSTNTVDDMQGYAVVLDTTKTVPLRLYLYKYGPKTNETVNSFLGQIGDYVDVSEITPTANKEIGIYVNVKGDMVEAYVYDKADPTVKSKTVTENLKSKTNSVNDNGQYYSDGKVGFFIGVATGGSYVNALDGIVLGDAQDIITDSGSDTPIIPSQGIAATDDSKGSAVKGSYSPVGNVTASNADVVDTKNLSAYAADFDNYTFYSSSATNKFKVVDGSIVSTTAGAKRAMLDGVSVKGFHAAATMKVTEEGTMRSGIVFRVNNIQNGVKEDGTLAANDIEGYSAILYKTPGTTDSYARVVMCVYKYGIVNGKYTYLGTVASKASEVPLTGFEKEQKAAAGQVLTMDVNVIDDELTMFFYNEANPELKSESLVVDLNNETDVEKNTPSLKGVHYDSGAIGLTATDHAIFTKFVVGEPNYPSNEVGDLSSIESYTIYGSGAKQEGEYITSNSSGTKKLIVNNLTVKDFKASMDMTIDENGNLKTGLFFRVNEVGNGADDQTGWAIVVTRNFATNGETNPNRIDIVLFKWGYSKGKLSYLGEVSREVYKSGASFVDGKMAGEELTFVVQVNGAGIDATLYKKSDPTNKPVTFSSNLKFAGKNEKEDVAYFESGSIGIYLGNSVSDPVNYNRVRNFRIDDGSGVEVKSGKKGFSLGSTTILGVPVTGEGILITLVAVAFVASAVFMVVTGRFTKKGKHSIGESEE